jgi:hypothetical protein
MRNLDSSCCWQCMLCTSRMRNTRLSAFKTAPFFCVCPVFWWIIVYLGSWRFYWVWCCVTICSIQPRTRLVAFHSCWNSSRWVIEPWLHVMLQFLCVAYTKCIKVTHNGEFIFCLSVSCIYRLLHLSAVHFAAFIHNVSIRHWDF